MLKQREFYKQTEGVENEGYKFEMAMLMYYSFLLCTKEEIKDFKISTSDQDYKPFDDIVMQVFGGSEEAKFALQLKHIKKNLPLTPNHFNKNGKINLCKYFKFDFKKSTHALLITNGHLSDNFTINHFDFTPKTSCGYMEEIVDTCTDLYKNHIFFVSHNGNHITLYTSQKDWPEIEDILKMQYQKQFLIDPEGVGKITKEYKLFFENWKKSDKPIRLDKEDIKMKIAEILFFDHLIDFQPKFDVEVPPKQRVLQAIINDYPITIVRDLDSVNLSKLCLFSTSREAIEQCMANFLIANASMINIALWRSRQFPLFLKFDTTNQMMLLNLIDQLVGENFRFVLVGGHPPLSDRSVFKSLANLDVASYNYQFIIEHFQISIQNHPPTTIAKLLTYNPHFAKIITLSELLSMLDGTFGVDLSQVNLPQPYIPRRINTKLLPLDKLNQLPKGAFLITGTPEQLNQIRSELTMKHLGYVTKNDKILAGQGLDDIIKKKVILAVEGEVTIEGKYQHLRVFNQRYLQLVTGKQLTNNCLILSEEQLFNCFNSNVKLICSRPGMGKHTMLKYLTLNSPEGYWCVAKDFKAYQQSSGSPSRFAVEVRKCFEEVGRIIYFLYGLESLDVEDLEEAIGDVEELARRNFQVYIFAEDNLGESLGEKLQIPSMELVEFNELEQKQYIAGRIIDIPMETILVWSKNLKNEILGIPLYLFMLTEIFLNGPRKNMEDIFTLTEICHSFLQIKFDRYLSRFGEYRCDQLIQNGVRYRICQYQIAAMLCLPEIAKNLPLQCDGDFLQQIRRMGDILKIISKISPDGRFIFHQQTYIHYFAATWLSSNHHKIPNFSQLFFLEEHKNIRLMFNLEVCKGNPAHIALLYRNYQQLLKHRDKLDEVDPVGRTIHHLLASEGGNLLKLQLTIKGEIFKFGQESEKEDEEMREIADFLLGLPFDTVSKDALFQWNLFQYASQTLNLQLLGACAILQLNLPDDDLFSMIYYSIKFGHFALLKQLVKTPLFRRILPMKSHHGETLLHMAVKAGHYPIVHLLIGEGGDVNALATNHDQAGPLHLAAKANDRPMTELLLQHGASIDIMDRRRQTPLHFAAANAGAPLVRLLLNKGADVNFQDNFGSTPLHLAAVRGHLHIIELLLKNGANVKLRDKIQGASPIEITLKPKAKALWSSAKYSPDAATSRRKSLKYENYFQYPLHYAAHIGHVADIGRILGNGCPIDGFDVSGRTPLHIALCRQHFDMVKGLIGHGADVNIPDGNHQISPICWAINSKNVEIVDFLLEHGAKLDCIDNFGYSPLHWAAMQGNADIFKSLLMKSPDLEVVDSFGRKPIDWAMEMGYSSIVQLCPDCDKAALDVAMEKDNFVSSYESVSKNMAMDQPDLFLQAVNLGDLPLILDNLNKGRGVNERDSLGNTPLYRATVQSQTKVVQALLDNHADVNCTNNFKSTPLHWAAQIGHAPIAKILLERGARNDIEDDFSCIPLHLAASKDHCEVIQLLLDFGGEVNKCDKYGNTALDLACTKGQVNAVKLLLEHGGVGGTVRGHFMEISRKQREFFNIGKISPSLLHF